MKIKQLIHVRNKVFRAASIGAIELLDDDENLYPGINIYFTSDTDDDGFVVTFDTPAQAQEAFIKLASDWADYMNSGGPQYTELKYI